MIKITDQYFIEVSNSPVCYTLKRRWMSQPKDATKEPTERFAVIGFYPSVEGALKGIAEQIVADAFSVESYSLEEAINMIVEKRDEVMRMIEGLNVG